MRWGDRACHAAYQLLPTPRLSGIPHAGSVLCCVISGGSSVCEAQLWCTLVRGGPPAPPSAPAAAPSAPVAAPGAPADEEVTRKPRGSVTIENKMNPSWKIWCPSSGKVYSTRDPFCPVKSIYVLADPTNVWGNCQKFDDPARVQFSVQDSSAWRALYGSGGSPVSMPCVQPKTIDYSAPAPHHDKELREKLALIVRDAFMKWRPLHKTVWNRHACDVLRGLVRRLEAPRSCGGTVPPPSAPLLRLYQSYSVSVVCVVPLSLPVQRASRTLHAIIVGGA
ncbi:hypothetical protein FHG87_015955 [Trinorchestia longiramus]|nr:hypothetical protein FHG87_015955 [Trinorchestia longiramus]